MTHFVEDTSKQTCICTLDRQLVPLKIEKKFGGHIFFHICTEKGFPPQELAGRYSSMQSARAAVEAYDKNTGQTIAARRQERRQERDERIASSIKPKSSK
jgi:hypothetical protein